MLLGRTSVIVLVHQMKKNIVLLFMLMIASKAMADFETDAPLSFGTIAITANDVVSSTTIRPNGQQTSDNNIWVITPGTPGVYTISGLAPFTDVGLSVGVPAASAEPYPDTAQFTVSAVEVPTSLKLDGSGQGQFTMGATLQSSGDNTENYYNASYTIFLDITLTY